MSIASRVLMIVILSLPLASISLYSGAATNSYDNQKCAYLGLSSSDDAKACYIKALKETEEALKEYRDNIEESPHIPPQVKIEVIEKYNSSMQAINKSCREAACRNNEMHELTRLMYQMTRTYAVPRPQR